MQFRVTGGQGAGAYLTCHRARGKVHPDRANTERQTTFYTHIHIYGQELPAPSDFPRAVVDQLTGILTRLLNLYLTHATISTFMQATIISIPKKTGIDSLNYCTPIALTSLVRRIVSA